MVYCFHHLISVALNHSVDALMASLILKTHRIGRALQFIEVTFCIIFACKKF